ncbi:MAG: hypothetical protein C0463_08230 [Idiomarina sp.]|nr:hypothetical protein [Idiomarina sp.]
MSLIRDANQAGARFRLACDEVGISLRTYKRWYRGGKVTADKRPEAIRPEPMNKLIEYEQRVTLDVCNESQFASLPPTQIVPALLDDGLYYGSEFTYYRVLEQYGQLPHRGRSLAPLIRWGKRKIRNYIPIGATTLNPAKEQIKQEQKQAA